MRPIIDFYERNNLARGRILHHEIDDLLREGIAVRWRGSLAGPRGRLEKGAHRHLAGKAVLGNKSSSTTKLASLHPRLDGLATGAGTPDKPTAPLHAPNSDGLENGARETHMAACRAQRRKKDGDRAHKKGHRYYRTELRAYKVQLFHGRPAQPQPARRPSPLSRKPRRSRAERRMLSSTSLPLRAM